MLSAYQWYWAHQVEISSCEGSTIVTENDCGRGEIMSIVATSGDVLHSMSLQLFGVHSDCMPGKMIGHDVAVI